MCQVRCDGSPLCSVKHVFDVNDVCFWVTECASIYVFFTPEKKLHSFTEGVKCLECQRETV